MSLSDKEYKHLYVVELAQDISNICALAEDISHISYPTWFIARNLEIIRDNLIAILNNTDQAISCINSIEELGETDI